MEKREKFSRIILFFFTFFMLLNILQFLAPFSIKTASMDDLSGMTVISDNKESVDSLSFPWSSIYHMGDIFCHQKAKRSFFINGNQMPFCSRCTAIWLGLSVGLGFMVFFRINLDEKFVFLLLVGIIPIGVDGVGQLFSLWESNNLIRVLTGLLVGIFCGIAIGVIFDEIKFINKFKGRFFSSIIYIIVNY